MSLAKLIKEKEVKIEKINGGSMKKMIVSLMLILSMFAFAAESAPSATVGYVKYPCVTGNSFVALPMQDTYTTASTLSPSITAVYRYLTATQKWDGALKGGFGWTNNFNVVSGQSYWVGATAPLDFIVDGEVVANPQYNIVTGNNALMLPLSKSNMLLADDYFDETGVITSVYRYLTATQKWDGALKGGFGWTNNFAVSIAEPHWVGATGPVVWPGAKGVGEDKVLPPPKGNPKQFVFGVKDKDNAEYDAVTSLGLTYNAWLTQGTGPAVVAEYVRSTDGLANCNTVHYYSVRGAAQLDLQEFSTWDIGNVINMKVKDENGGLKAFYEVDIVYPITNAGLGLVEEGFFDLLGTGVMPWLVSTLSSVEDDNLPTVTTLHQNYPNPFNPTTTIKFDLASTSNVKLNVYNYNGQLVRSLVNGQMEAGYQSVNFDASNLSAGVYYYTMEADSKIMTNKMVLVK
jgi:hypothetical protein